MSLYVIFKYENNPFKAKYTIFDTWVFVSETS